ncbi:MAG: cold-shock protein, partial [Woeseia sp.]
YHFDPIRQSEIVTLTAQTKSFVAMFLNEPHSHPRYYGELLKAYETRLFVGDHKPELYFASGLAYLTTHKLFNRGVLPKRMRNYLYHMLMLLRIQLMGMSMPRFNSHNASDYAIKLIDKLSDEDECKAKSETSAELIQSTLAGFDGATGRNPPSRIRAFTELLLNEISAGKDAQEEEPEPPLVIGKRETGTLRWFNELKGFGFIQRDQGGEIFVHHSGLKRVPWKYWQQGSRFSYEIVQGKKSPAARVLEVITG